MIAVILAAPDSKTRFAEAASLLNYGYSRCSLYVDEMPESLLPVEVLKGVETQIQPIYEKTFTYLSTTGEDFSQITKEITMDSKIEAPFEKGTKIGIVRYKLGDKDIGSVNIVASASAARAGFGDCIGKVMRIVFD